MRNKSQGGEDIYQRILQGWNERANCCGFGTNQYETMKKAIQGLQEEYDRKKKIELTELFETVVDWLKDIGMEAIAEEFGDKTMEQVMEMETQAVESVLQAAEDKRLPNVHKMRTDLEKKTRPIEKHINNLQGNYDRLNEIIQNDQYKYEKMIVMYNDVIDYVLPGMGKQFEGLRKRMMKGRYYRY